MINAVELAVFSKSELVTKLSGKTFSLEVSVCGLKSCHSRSKLPWLFSVEILYISGCCFLLATFLSGTIVWFAGEGPKWVYMFKFFVSNLTASFCLLTFPSFVFFWLNLLNWLLYNCIEWLLQSSSKSLPL